MKKLKIRRGEKNIIISVPEERIESKILLIRDKKVMLDRDLAELYKVETAQLKRQVRRNIERFPNDFMFKLTRQEYRDILRCQFGTLEMGKYSKYLPYAFTEHGILMLSSVLNSKRAIQVNIHIMRAFIKLREYITTHKDLQKKIEEHDTQIAFIFKLLKPLLPMPGEPDENVGFA
jgi:hypothetical protein